MKMFSKTSRSIEYLEEPYLDVATHPPTATHVLLGDVWRSGVQGMPPYSGLAF